METFIRTPDMPGVHQTADVSEVMPSDYELSPIVRSWNERNYDGNTGSYFDTNPDLNAKRLHASYNDIINVVNKCVERGAGIIWDSYQEFIKMKSGNPSKYKEAIDELEKINSNSLFCSFHTRLDNLTRNKKLINSLLENDNYEPEIVTTTISSSEDEKFRRFYMAVLGDNPNSDIPALLNKEGYLDSIAQLRYELQTINSNVKFDIENCIEYTVHRRDCDYPVAHLNSIAFKIKPYLEGVSSNAGTAAGDSIPIVGYRVCMDMHKLIVWMLSNCTMPDELPEALEMSENVRDEYVKTVIGEYSGFGERIARRIVMELFDQNYNIHGNWTRFLNKFMSSYNKMLEDEDLSNLISKIQYFANGSSTLTDSATTSKVSLGADSELINNILVKVNKSEDNNDSFINQLFVAISSNTETNKGDFILQQATVLFKKTFSVFFEDAVLLNFFKEYQSEHYAKNIKLISYAREFNKNYDIVDLLGKASSISDYNVRDFMQTIIGEVKHLKCMIYDPAKLSNGEYASWLYSKLSREIWLRITNSVILASKLISTMEQVKPRYEEIDTFDKVYSTLNRFVDNVYSNFLYILSEARFVPTKRGFFSGIYSYDPMRRVREIYNICYNYAKPVVSADIHKFDELLSSKKFKDCIANASIDTGFIVSYDVSDNYWDELKHNFIMALKRRDVLSIDF